MRAFLLRPHTTFVARVVLLSVMVGCLAAAVATYFDPTWPVTSEQWWGFALVIGIIWFVSIKIYEMSWPVTVWTRLGASLVAANVGFLVVYLVALFLSLWPQFAANVWIRIGIRADLIVFLGWSVYELLKRPRWGGDAHPWKTAGLTAAAAASVAFLWWRIH